VIDRRAFIGAFAGGFIIDLRRLRAVRSRPLSLIR